MKKIIFFFSLAIILNSCSVEILTDGCTDPYADNFNPNADTEDGTCLYTCVDPYATNYNVVQTYYRCDYEADVVFYADVSAATYFNNLGLDWLDIYVGNDYVGTISATLGFTYVPDCYPIDPDAVHFTLLWEDAISSSFTWSVRDLTGFKHYEGNDLIVANNCLPMQLTHSLFKEYQEATK